MSQSLLIELIRDALIFTGLIAGPFLIAALLIGFFISLIQAATQIQEATLSFFPKWLILIALGLLIAPWLLTKTKDYVTHLYLQVPRLIRMNT